MEQPLDIAQFAALCAELDAGEPEGEVLARQGLSADAWRAVEEGWLERIASESPERRVVLTRQYNVAFSARRRVLGVHGPASGAMRAASDDEEAWEGEELNAPISEQEPLEAPPAMAQPPPSPASLFTPVESKEPPPKPEVALPSFMMTARAGLESGAAPPPIAPPQAPPPIAPPQARKRPPPMPTMAMPQVVDPAEGARSPLPFVTPVRPAAPAAAQAKAPAGPRGPRLTLEQFASLVAELSASGRPADEVRGRYGLTETTHREEAAAWQRVFATEAGLHTRWMELCKTYRDWLARRR